MERTSIRAGRPTKALMRQLGDHVVEVADSLFIAKGYSATSMAMVAISARVGKQTLYRRFPDKATLFREVVRRRIEAIAIASAHDHADGRPLDALKQLASRLLSSALEPNFVRLFRIVIAESAMFPELAHAAGDYWGSTFVSRCAGAIARAQAAGLCRAGDPETIAQCFLWSLVGQPFNKALIGVETMNSESERRDHLELAWGIFVHGVAPPP